jgi:histidyl-tRNA synthetase
VSGGGRYDLLAQQLGGPSTPGIGFAAGIERVLLAVPESDDGDSSILPGCFIISADETFREEALRLAAFLRKHDIPSDIDYQSKSLKAQMKQAGKSGLRYSIIMAGDEMSRGNAVLRNMIDSSQIEVSLSDIYNVDNVNEFGELFEKGK